MPTVSDPLPRASALTRERGVWRLLARVPDPEIPVLSIIDLGIVREVRQESGRLRVAITPTYSGCPATEVIRGLVRAALDAGGHRDAVLEEVLSPPWTSDWLTPAGREKLRSFGIAPPEQSVTNPRELRRPPAVSCPRCASRDTQRVSEFGSTPCKAHYRCAACGEPFDYFKCL
ncbi:MAG TPA: 1,2-phenylacetyl-CoA epoxidase subunit PaaD [Steroidobacteraceae bacterium]|nr:1,2-phenylacetyl-CoA epoxidase subunit PaaD [Steroidobacteraceae bacterium]